MATATSSKGVYNSEEVLEIACRIEENGARFYHEAARHFDEPNAKQMFLALARMEEEHEVTFNTMRGTPDTLAEVLGDPDDLTVSYLHAIAGGSVFPVDVDPVSMFNGHVTVTDVIKKAIGLEKDSIVFYQGIREMVAEGNGRSKVEAILREEMSHISLLSDALKAAAI